MLLHQIGHYAPEGGEGKERELLQEQEGEGDLRLAIGNWRLGSEAGGLAIGDWRLAIGE